MSDHLKGLLITTLGVLFIVPESLMVRLIAAEGLTIAFWKALLTGSVIGIGLLVLQGPAAFRRVLALGPLTLVYAACVGASGVGFVVAVSLTSVANVVFIVAAMPVFAALFSRVALGEAISRRTALTIAAVLAGLGIIAYGSGETEGASRAGDLMALAVAAFFAAGLTVARRLRPASMVPAIPIGYLITALVLLPFVDPLAVPAESWVWVFLLGGVLIVGSTVFITLGPRYLPSAEVALLILLESVLAPLLVWAVVGEDPGKWALIGGALVIGALAVSNLWALFGRRRKAVISPPVPPVSPDPA